MKRKAWDITVKDNPNRVIMGENDEFYTTDTEAYLVFKLDDENFNPATAVLTLENSNDGSLKNETVDVVDGLIEWEMPQRYIEHFGNWKGQLVYEDTKDGQPELYTSAPFTFVVNAHIGDKKKPSLVEIENWEKFIRDGTELIETWEDMEDLRQANEAQRQENYQELLDTGVLQTNINTKLEALEEEYTPKLTEVTAQLAQTMQEQSNKVDKAGSGQVRWSNLAQDARQQISGNKVAVVEDDSIITTNLTDNAVKTSKIGDKEVTARTTDFIETSSNLLNIEDVVENKVISGTGEMIDNTGYYYSHIIDVLPGQTLYTTYVTTIAWYDQNGNFMSRPDIGNPAKNFSVVPDNAYYARANISRIYYDSPDRYDLMIAVSDVEIPYEPFYELLDGVQVSADKVVGQLNTSAIGDKTISHSKTNFIKTSTNLLDRENVKKGAISADGTINEQINYYYSHRIEVMPNQTVFTRYITHLVWYDFNGDFISRPDIGDGFNGFRTVPDNAYYLRVNISGVYFNNPTSYPLQVSLSDVELPYEPYYLTIDNLEDPPPSLMEFKGDDLYVVDGKVDETYQTAQLEGYENVETDWLPEKIYQKFDELVANHPSYVIKENLGIDSSGNFDINLYRFRPEQVATLSDTKLPKIFIVAGNHGYEKTHPYILYLVMKKLCEEWQTDESLETLRWNVEFLIIPCANPSSFETGSRYNANGVDISRNFEGEWDTSPDENKGPYPLSEPEARYVDDVLKMHHDDTIFFTSLHNFSASNDPEATVNRPEHFIWVPAADKLQEHISQMFVSKMTRLWKKKYDWLPQDDDLYLGYVDRGTPHGSEGLHGSLYGITASTYEVSRIFRLEENPVASSSQVITMGVEALVNLLLLNLKVGTDYYNRNKKVLKR